MVLRIGIALVVEVVQQRDGAPVVFVLAELPRVAAHRGLDAEHVLPQALALRVLGHQRPGVSLETGTCVTRRLQRVAGLSGIPPGL